MTFTAPRCFPFWIPVSGAPPGMHGPRVSQGLHCCSGGGLLCPQRALMRSRQRREQVAQDACQSQTRDCCCAVPAKLLVWLCFELTGNAGLRPSTTAQIAHYFPSPRIRIFASRNSKLPEQTFVRGNEQPAQAHRQALLQRALPPLPSAVHFHNSRARLPRVRRQQLTKKPGLVQHVFRERL